MSHRLLLGIAVLMMLVPSFLFWSRPFRPLMVEGDRLEDRACTVCQGQDTECKRCRGKGVLSFLVPGPQRPTHIVGHIYGPDQAPVEAANVTILTPVEPIPLRTDEQGRFGATLPPGNYTLVVNVPGQKETRQDLSVAKLTEAVPSHEQVTFPVEDRAFNLPQP